MADLVCLWTGRMVFLAGGILLMAMTSSWAIEKTLKQARLTEAFLQWAAKEYWPQKRPRKPRKK